MGTKWGTKVNLDILRTISSQLLKMKHPKAAKAEKVLQESIDGVANQYELVAEEIASASVEVFTKQKLNQLIWLLEKKKTSPSFENILLWAKQQLTLLQKENITLNQYLIFHLGREIQEIQRHGIK